MMQLTYVWPDVLERSLLLREAASATLMQMIEGYGPPWAEQIERAFK